jgi:hypothetical protein
LLLYIHLLALRNQTAAAAASVLACSFAPAAERQFGMHGYDRVRNTQIGKTEVPLKYFEEVFTSEHWMMRIYRCANSRVCCHSVTCCLVLVRLVHQRALDDAHLQVHHFCLENSTWQRCHLVRMVRPRAVVIRICDMQVHLLFFVCK